jgi:hypothetical protein
MRRQVYVLDVGLLEGIIEEEFIEENPKVSRVIEIQGHQTLEQLHQAIFQAFEREEQHHYEFQLDKKASFPDKRFVLAEVEEDEVDECGIVENTTIQELKLKEGDLFGYLFDYGDMWIHQINVLSIKEEEEAVSYPRVTKKVGQSPPQYPDW